MSHKFTGFLLLLISFGTGWSWMDYQNALANPVVKDGQILIDIEKGDSINRIVDKLASQNLDIKRFWFKAIAFQKNAATKLKTGEYELAHGLTIPEIIDLFVQGKTRQYAITFPEGWCFKEILQEINRNTSLEHTLDSDNLQKLMTELGADGKIPEGLFFPDTYFFEKHMSDVSLLKRAYEKMHKVMDEEWRNKENDLPFQSPYQALILASIIEKETGAGSERQQIAGVFIRRLKLGMPLQTDPTVIYGMGDHYHGNIRAIDLKTQTPYNTYLLKGLPPTPIAMPGREAIHSVMHPDDSDNLYFVARGDGTHEFSPTLKEHNRAVRHYQKKSRHAR